MTDKRDEHPRDKKTLSQAVQAFVKKRADNRGEKVLETRKHVEIQLLLSELENLLLNMTQDDAQVVAARAKLKDLKKLISKTLDI